MAATVHVFFDFGGSDGTPGTEQDIEGLGPPTLRLKTNDNATIDTNDPIPIPSSGTKYSYWKHIYLEVTAGTFTQIDNVKLYTDGGGFGTGIAVKIGDEMPTKNSGANTGYEVASGTPGDTGDEMVANHSGLSGSTDIFTYTSGSPKSISISESGNIIDAVGESTNYALIQMEVINTASQGDKDNETWTYQYDEI